MTENPLGYEKISKLLKILPFPVLWRLLSAQSTILWIRFLLVKGSVIWEMQQPMLPTRFLPSALPLHYWSELAVLLVFPSVLGAKIRKLPPKQREMVLF